MDLSRRTLLQLFAIAPALGLSTGALASFEAFVPEVQDRDAEIRSGVPMFVQNQREPRAIAEMSSPSYCDHIDVTCYDDDFRRFMPRGPRRATVVIEGAYDDDGELSRFEIRMRGATVRFNGFVERYSYGWNSRREAWESRIELMVDESKEAIVFEIDEAVERKAA